MLLGFFVGAPVCGKSSDKLYQHFKRCDPNGRGKPEFRIPAVGLFAWLAPLGLLIFGWAAEHRVHLVVPNIGLFLFSIGTIAAYQCVTSYMVDTYARFAASAVAAITILRSMAGGGFPLYSPSLIETLRLGRAFTVLAMVLFANLLAVPAVWLFGERLRKRSKMSFKPPPGKPQVQNQRQAHTQTNEAAVGEDIPPPYSAGSWTHADGGAPWYTQERDQTEDIPMHTLESNNVDTR